MNIFEMFEAKKKSLKNPADNPCWTGYHPVGTKKKAGRTVPNCVPNEGVDEAANAAQQAAIAIAKKKKAGVAEAKHQLQWTVEQHTNGHHNAFYIVRGHDRPREVWKDAQGRSDFKNRTAAEAKAAELNQQGMTEGWKNIVGAGTLALGALGAGVANATDQSNSQQYAQLADKYYNVLVQRAKEDGRELDTRTLNGLKSRALDAATKTMEKNKSQPPQGSERRVAKDADQFESPGVAAKVQPIQELSSDALDRYKVKAKKSADELTSLGKYRQANDRTMNVMKATGKQIDKTVTNIRNALNRESTNQGMAEDAEQLNVGDDVIITGDVQFNGATGVIDSFGRDHRFVVVNLYNHGRHSFHSSDVSFNDYADSDDEQARMYDAGEFRGHTDDDIMESRLQQMRAAGYDIL
jgi:hypothetical protein